MSTKSEHIFGKFIINKDLGLAADFVFSSDRFHVDTWSGTRKEAESSKDERSQPNVPLFGKLGHDFLASQDEYNSAVPALMFFAPLIKLLHIDRELRKFAANNGSLLQAKDGTETYELPFNLIVEVTRRANGLNALSAGLSRLPNMFLMGLVSSYDAFFSKLMRTILLTRPEIISSSERSISLRDLLQIGSIEAAREQLIDREIDNTMRLSHADQIEWIEKRLGLRIREGNDVWPKYVELFERRNLLTHTAGIVSHQYLSVCKEHGADVDGISVGQELFANSKYLEISIDLLTEFGIKLIQKIWRRMLPNDINLASEQLGTMGYELIKSRRYRLAARVLRFGLYDMKEHGTEALKKRMIVNYANAEKLAGDKVLAIKILDEEDWTAATANYQICVAAIKDDVERVVELMSPVVSANLVAVNDFREWPMFEPIRANPTFVAGFEAAFGEPLFRDTDTKMAMAGAEKV